MQAKNALFGLGIFEAFASWPAICGRSCSRLRNEENLEQWVCNRFGSRLYEIFFKTYTEKVWGVPCTNIRAEWAAQRIRGLSLTTAIRSALLKTNSRNHQDSH